MQADRLRLAPYRPELADRWNAFVADSKNGTFLFDRGYMDYHDDRFVDGSLVAFEGDDESTIAALLPASRHDDRLVSHGGLTYGGWVTDQRMTSPAMLRLFELLRAWAPAAGVSSLRYKAVPRCYHRLPAEEDLYGLFVQGAVLARQDLTSVLELAAAPEWASRRKRALAKSRAQGVSVGLSRDWADFLSCLSEVLVRHGAAPVHTAAELELLSSRFPDRIRLYCASLEGRAAAYVLVYDCGQTAHTQYLASTETGRASGALEAIVHRLITQDYAGRRYLSFGISTEDEGRTLNQGLVAQKEMFGARAMVCPFYDLSFAD